MADQDSPPSGGRWGYELTGHCSAPRQVVWPLLASAERWKDWSFLTRSFLVRQGQPEPDGVGALRRFAVGPFGSVEEVVAFEPPRHLGYIGRRGLPVRSYRADVVLDDGSGTLISWRGSLTPLVPGTGALVLAGTRAAVARFLPQLIRFADKEGPARA